MFRYPDKPNLVNESFFKIIDENWIIESKLDGYRALIIKENNRIRVISRHNKPLNVKNDILGCFDSIPNNSIIDSEWINHSRIKTINEEYKTKLPMWEALAIFDVLSWDGEWQGNKTLRERLKNEFLCNLPNPKIHQIMEFDVFRMPVNVGGKYCENLALYEQQKKYLISEGIVAKKLNSTVIGSTRNSADNKSWYKIKYRNAS